MIALEGVSYSYSPAPPPWILKDIHLHVFPGEYVALFGASGSGKSTLAYLLNGLIPHFFDGRLEGKATVCGIDVAVAAPGCLLPQVGLVLQNTDAHLFSGTVRAELAFGLENLGVGRREMESRIGEICRRLPLQHLLDRSPHELSGGEKQLVAIASVLCLGPRVLILDEPFAHLDPPNRNRIRKILRSIHKTGTTLIVAEHLTDAYLRDVSRVVVLDGGSIRYDGAPDTCLPHLKAAGIVPDYSPMPSPVPPDAGEIVLETQDVGFRFSQKAVLEHVSFELRRGERVAILGPNGAGKTTLVQILGGLVTPTHGQVLYRGQPVHGRPAHRIASQIGISFQNPNDQFFKPRVEDEVLAGVRLLGAKGLGPPQAWVEAVCDLFEITPLWQRSPYRLSEGEKKRVALASIAAMGPGVLIWDEPTAGQDGRFRRHLARLMGQLSERGTATLVVTHDLAFAQATCTRWLHLEKGRITRDTSLPVTDLHTPRFPQ
ncbi:energy-coupling factor transport system ATP-binding protein [Desulfacinum hydrothermale DSM 13146]|uniref:Energy-coupling factor transport system ATP-binding protein n=1 Tax=Desulfacinum hydrothermale DSM 13146 TaxID=1121390 RepID=A0A1W1XT90_9BACT|nr:ABC transporter ATP-binding protein [Desulfacinum hydrothermale]SMC27179.1 energy-coupling factor transport system ATP-binding protein [Desulfacinum hydrothermale DSM 13146]